MKRMSFLRSLKLGRLTWVFLVAATGVHAATSHQVLYEFDVEMKTRDGVLLRADIYRPKASGRFPVILHRSPYDKRRPRYIADGIASAQRGYIYVMQDSRG